MRWNYLATSHGKGPVNGLNNTVKIMLVREIHGWGKIALNLDVCSVFNPFKIVCSSS